MTDAFAGNGVPDAMKSYEISVDAYVAAAGPSNPERRAYLDLYKQDVTSMLTDEVAKIIQEKNQWILDSCGLGVRGDDIAEMLHHYSWARDKCSDFEGREDLLALALQRIRSENRKKKSGLKE
jgi:hypothetical protein